ncbi:unnamed protein product [Cylindrotheca closterium]|uniref:Uncharacterized protein n=1 Tax=Cylindrotheca closterium TaxID=2856 RepID=A0AAD2GBC2_9STRA|nr:unnamed protein product [Cylindrotheca closterium]
MTEEKDLIIDEGDLETFLKPSKAGNDDDGSMDAALGDRQSQAHGFGDSFSSIKDLLSVGSIQEDLLLEDDENATFTKNETSDNDPANVQALIDSYFAKLENKRDSTGADAAEAAAAAAAAVSEEDVKEIEDLNQVESYFDRIDSRNKLSGSGQRKVRSRRKKKSGNSDDLMEKFLAMQVEKKSSTRSMKKSGSSNQAFGLSKE